MDLWNSIYILYGFVMSGFTYIVNRKPEAHVLVGIQELSF